MKIHNTLTGKKETFKPLKKGRVKFYTCGVTPYDLSHVGHARTYISFDVIRRYLEYKGYKVEYAVNVTDVDDKIIRRANEKGIEASQWADEMTELFLEDMKNLNVKKPTYMPRVTQTMDEIIKFIQKLIKKGYAYPLDGDVYFDVVKFRNYGKLSGNKTEAMKDGARIEPNQKKKNPGDFALWKAAKPGEPFWESGFSKGRPGWHIECSAMNMEIFGPQIDIHGGGSDLRFPHHENEIAQTEALTGKPFAKYWMHTGMVNVNGQKMSKSLGNFITIRDALAKWPVHAIRLLLLKTNYSSPIDFSDKSLEEAKEAQKRLQETFEKLLLYNTKAKTGSLSKNVRDIVKDAYSSFEKAMDNDFSTSEALASLFVLSKEVNRLLDSGVYSSKDLTEITKLFKDINSVFGILDTSISSISGALDLLDNFPKDIEELLIKRKKARDKKDFAESDRIRNELRNKGWEVSDTPNGQMLKRIE